MDKEPARQTDNNTTPDPVYPEPTKGALSDDHSDYGTQKTFAGGDPDKHMRLYFVLFLVAISLLFVIAVKLLSGEKFIF